MRAVIDCGRRDREVPTSARGVHAGKRIKLSDGAGRPPWSLTSDGTAGGDITYLQAPLTDASDSYIVDRCREVLTFWQDQMMAGRTSGVMIACDEGVRAWRARATGGAVVSGLDTVGVLVCAMLGLWCGEREAQWRTWGTLAEVLGGKDNKDIEKWQSSRRDWATLVSRMRDKFSTKALRTAFPSQYADENVPRGLIADAYMRALGVTERDVLHHLGFVKVCHSSSQMACFPLQTGSEHKLKPNVRACSCILVSSTAYLTME